MSKINTEVLPFNPFAVPEKDYQPMARPKWKHELSKEQRQPQESPLKRWYLENQSRIYQNNQSKRDSSGVQSTISENRYHPSTNQNQSRGEQI